MPFRRGWLKRDDFSVIGNISKTPFSEGCGYYFTFLANEKTILLLRQKRENDFTIARFEVESGQD